MHEGALIGLAVGRLLRIPMVFDFQGSLTGEMLDHEFLRQDSVFYRLSAGWRDRSTTCRLSILTSSHNARQPAGHRVWLPPDKVRTLADCVDAEAFYPGRRRASSGAGPAPRRAGHPADRKVVVYLGLLADYQGTDALLQAAARISATTRRCALFDHGLSRVDHYQQMARTGHG